MDNSINQEARLYLQQFDVILKQMSASMLYPKLTNNITLDFIRCMIPHHEAAIQMSNNLLRFTNYPPLIRIANNIIKVQQEEIQTMKDIARTTSREKNSKGELNLYWNRYFEITINMINQMQNSARTPDINLDFTTEMIPHHEGAIELCQNVMNFMIDPRLRSLASKIIREQTVGVEELKQIRSQLVSR